MGVLTELQKRARLKGLQERVFEKAVIYSDRAEFCTNWAASVSSLSTKQTYTALAALCKKGLLKRAGPTLADWQRAS